MTYQLWTISISSFIDICVYVLIFSRGGTRKKASKYPIFTLDLLLKKKKIACIQKLYPLWGRYQKERTDTFHIHIRSLVVVSLVIFTVWVIYFRNLALLGGITKRNGPIYSISSLYTMLEELLGCCKLKKELDAPFAGYGEVTTHKGKSRLFIPPYI